MWEISLNLPLYSKDQRAKLGKKTSISYNEILSALDKNQPVYSRWMCFVSAAESCLWMRFLFPKTQRREVTECFRLRW